MDPRGWGTGWAVEKVLFIRPAPAPAGFTSKLEEAKLFLLS